jgi:hypothetical protein
LLAAASTRAGASSRIAITVRDDGPGVDLEVRVDPADPGSVATPEATCAEIASLLGWSLDVFSDERVWTVRVRARSHGEDVAAEQPTEGSGLEAARRDPPDRIICDIALPGASGDTFLTDSTNWHVRS